MNNTSLHKLNYRVSGTGYPVVFLHGFLESLSMWDFLDLSAFKSIFIDLPGHGASAIEEQETMPSMARKVKQIIDEIGLEGYILVGHSMGGYVGLEVCENDPSCEKLILLNSNFWSDSEQKKIDRTRVSEIVLEKKVQFIREAIPNLFEDAFKFEDIISDLIKEANQIEAKAIAVCSLAMRDRADKSNWVAKQSDKVVVIQGVNDPNIPSSKMKEISDKMGLKYHEVDSGHMAHIEATQSINEILTKEIKKTETISFRCH